MRNIRINKIFSVVFLILTITFMFSIPVLAGDGDIEVEVIVKSFDGSQGVSHLQVEYFGQSMLTSRRGTANFDLKGLAENEMGFISIYDETGTNYYGGITTYLNLSPDTSSSVRPDGNPGVFEADINYTSGTNKVVIETILTQSADIEIVNIDFEQGWFENREEPPHEEGFDPDLRFDPDRPFAGSWIMIIMAVLIAVLLIVIIVLLVKKIPEENNY